MLKLVQEVHGHANFWSRRQPGRATGLMLMPSRYSGRALPNRRKTLTILMQDAPDIPAPVAIKHLRPTVLAPQPPAV